MWTLAMRSTEWLSHRRIGYNYRLSDINCALGSAQQTITIRSQDAQARARMTYAGNSSNVIEFNTPAEWVILKWIEFGQTQAGVDAIKIKALNHKLATSI